MNSSVHTYLQYNGCGPSYEEIIIYILESVLVEPYMDQYDMGEDTYEFRNLGIPCVKSSLTCRKMRVTWKKIEATSRRDPEPCCSAHPQCEYSYMSEFAA